MQSFAYNSIVILCDYFANSVPHGKEKLIYDGAFSISEYYLLEVKLEYAHIDPHEEHQNIFKLQNILMQVYL